MKKILLTFMLVFAAVLCWAQHRYADDINDLTMGVTLGEMHEGTGKNSEFGWGVYVEVYNIYADAMFAGPTHHSDIGISEWRDTKKFACHLGYRISAGDFGVTPLIGYAHLTRGITDGSRYSISRGGYIHNRYTPYWTRDTMDYGCRIDYTFIFNMGSYDGGFQVAAEITRYSYMGGIGFVTRF